jgi:hypothetical protein
MAGHVGVCVVYLVDAPYEFLFYKHLEQLRRCTRPGAIRLYAGVNRLAPRYVEALRALDFVQICELAPTELRNSEEHAHYLDQLVEIALADGAAQVATLDVDSFPIDPTWLERAQAGLDNGAALAAVLRRENGDVAAPHPSFMFFSRGFVEQHRPTFRLLRGDPRAEAFLRATGQPRLDTGAGYALALYENRLPWMQLLRSNAVNDHPLLGGVYGRMVYHFGGGSRDKVFVLDIAQARRTRPNATLQELWPEIAARNETIARRMLSEMQSDFDAYIARLLGRSVVSLA